MVKTCSYPEHYFCRENTIFIGKVTDTAVFVGNVAYGFDSYAVSGTFGGLENIVFLPYFTIESILHMNQKQMIMVGINLHINLPAGLICFHTCLDGIFQQIGKYKAQINLIFKVWGYSFKENLLAGTSKEGTSRNIRSYEEAMKQLTDTIRERLAYLDKELGEN